MLYFGFVLLLLTLLAGWVLNWFCLPGNWLMCAAVALFAWLAPDDSRFDVSWLIVAVILVMATVGEILEFAAGAIGTHNAGGSKRGAVLAMIGAVAGSIAGAIIGLPVPVVGPLLALLLFGGLGAMAGATLGEIWKGKAAGDIAKIGSAAFIGSILGNLSKIAISTVIVMVTLVATLSH